MILPYVTTEGLVQTQLKLTATSTTNLVPCYDGLDVIGHGAREVSRITDILDPSRKLAVPN